LTEVDEAQAAEFRRAQTARAAWMNRQRHSALPSAPEFVAAFRAKWQPILDQNRGWDPPEVTESARGLQVP